MGINKISILTLILGFAVSPHAWAGSPVTTCSTPTNIAATVTALRMAGTLTGGAMSPCTDSNFTTMVSDIIAGNPQAAAQLVVSTPEFAAFLPRRMALQMMSPSLTEVGMTDNEASTLIIADFLGSGTTAGMNKIWSDNATYYVNTDGSGNPIAAPAGTACSYFIPGTEVQNVTCETTAGTVGVIAGWLGASALAKVNWQTDVFRSPGQWALGAGPSGWPGAPVTMVQIPAADVGGYTTASLRQGDTSFAQYGMTGGTNLREIEGIYEIATGYKITDMMSPATSFSASDAVYAPQFVPSGDPSFLQGSGGQPACLACHGMGVSNLTHGYGTVADLFAYGEYDVGVNFYAPVTNTFRKSLGSTFQDRINCTSSDTAACNPDSGAPFTNTGSYYSSTGNTSSSTITIQVTSSAPTGLAYGVSPLTGAVGMPIAPDKVNETITSATVSPALPEGLVLGSNGEIQGVPTTASASSSYTLTGKNSSGTSVSTTLSIQVYAEPPTPWYQMNPLVATVASPIPADTPLVAVSESETSAYSISPSPLPSGLTFNTHSGVISGTPTAVTAATTYTVTVTYAVIASATSASQAWNLSDWNFVTNVLGPTNWTGPTSGTGLNALGAALGAEPIVYTNMVNRVIAELCPEATTATSVSAIAQAAATADQAESGIGGYLSIVEAVAADPSCQ